MVEPVFDPNAPAEDVEPQFDPGAPSEGVASGDSSQWLKDWLLRGADTYGGDVADLFKQGIAATTNAPSKIASISQAYSQRKHTPERSQPITDEGEAAQDARERAAKRTSRAVKPEEGREEGNLANSAEGVLDLVGGPIQAVMSPAFGGLRSWGSRPIEEKTGFPKEATEAFAGALLPSKGSRGQRGTPTAQMLHDASNAGYDRLRNTPIFFNWDSYHNTARNIYQTLHDRGFYPRAPDTVGTAPETMSQLQRMMNNYIAFPSFDEFQSVRTKLGQIAKSRHGETGSFTPDAAAARSAVSMLDQALQRYGPQDVAYGQQHLPDLKTGIRDAAGDWAAYMRRLTVDRAVEKGHLQTGASGTGHNIENNLRRQIGNIVATPRKASMYTPEELAMMREFNQGTSKSNMMREMGRYSPSGSVPAAMSFGLSHLLAGHTGSAGKFLLPGVGYVTRKLADRAAERNAGDIGDAISRRSPSYRNQPRPPFRPGFPKGPIAGMQGLQEYTDPENYPPFEGFYAEGGGVEEDSPFEPQQMQTQDTDIAAPFRHAMGEVTGINEAMNFGQMSPEQQKEWGLRTAVGAAGSGIGKAIMVGPFGAMMMRGAQHPVVGKAMQGTARAATEGIKNTKIRDATTRGISEMREIGGGRPEEPIRDPALRDIQAQSALEMRGIAGRKEDYDIWKRSGWFRGVDNQPRKEIPDFGARLEPVNSGNYDTYRLHHPAGDLHKIYDIPPIKYDRNFSGAEFDPPSRQVTLGPGKSPEAVALHEMQHGIQSAEGMASGSNPTAETFFPEMWKELGETMPGKSALRQVAHAPTNDQYFMQKINYKRSAGETEARNVEERRRKGYNYLLHPRFTQDIPSKEQISRTQKQLSDRINEINKRD